MSELLYTDLDEKYIIERFPELEKKVIEEVAFLGEFLPHVIWGNIFNSYTVSLLKRKDYATNQDLKRIFEMYEDLSRDGDEDIQNMVEVTLLEYLWDEKITYDRALELMGNNTKKIWDNIQWLKVPLS